MGKTYEECIKEGMRFDIPKFRGPYVKLNKKIPINRTFFNYGLLEINDKNLECFDLPAEMAGDIKGCIYFNDDKYPDFKGLYYTNIVLRNGYSEKSGLSLLTGKKLKDEFKDETIKYDDTYVPDKFSDCYVSRPNVEYFSNLKELQYVLEDIFSATKFASRMTCEGVPVDIGENIDGNIYYRVENGITYLCLEITSCNTTKEGEIKLSINDVEYSIPVELCCKLEAFFPKGEVFIDTQKAKSSIIWNDPTDWIYSNKINDPPHSAVNNAVYMWRYTDSNTVHLGIDYVCNSSLKSEIEKMAQGRNDFYFRYSELRSTGGFSSVEVLKNVANHTGVVFNSIFQDNVCIYKDNKGYPLKLETTGNHGISNPTLDDVDISALENQYVEVAKEFWTFVKGKMIACHTCNVQVSKTANSSQDWFYKTSGWLNKDSIDSEDSKEAYFAVYSWYGHYECNDRANYRPMYIGIVGVTRNGSKNNNSVFKRIFDQEAKLDGIAGINSTEIEKFRYCRIKDDAFTGKKERSEAIQTLEMQCINNVSSLFKFNEISQNSYKELIIKPCFDGIVINGKILEVELLNRDKRYHNSLSEKAEQKKKEN